jgi:putative oxidoreductase
MKGLLYLGRWLFAGIFIASGYTHFTKATIAYASASGIPPWLTIAAGIMACVGGLCVATGYRSREGACLLVGFLVPVTLVMHRFWGLSDPQQAAMQLMNFIKNASLTGAALMIVYQGSTPRSGAEPSPRVELHRPARRVTHRELVGSQRS